MSAVALTADGQRTWDKPAMILCYTCGIPKSILKVRLINKTKNQFRCNDCSQKKTYLFRGFGSSIVPEAIPLHESQKFFASCELSQISVKAGFSKLIERYEVHEEYYEEGGLFLPLAVWERKGFDPDVIKAGTEPKDIQQHPVLGPCYRLRLLATGTRGNRGWRGSSSVTAQGKKRKLDDAFDDLHNEVDPKQRKLADCLAPPADPPLDAEDPQGDLGVDPEPEELPDSSESDSDSSSSSSSSSSSDKGKKKKKKKKKGKKDKKKDKKKEQQKKAKKEKKAKKKEQDRLKEEQKKQRAEEAARKAADKEREREERKAQAATRREEAAAQKQRDKWQSDAKKAIPKLTTALSVLAGTLALEYTKQIPPVIHEQAQKALKEMTAHINTLQQISCGNLDQEPCTKVVVFFSHFTSSPTVREASQPSS